MKTHSKLVIPMAEILTVWILCVFHHAWIFCWKQREKINCEMIKKKNVAVTERLSDSGSERVREGVNKGIKSMRRRKTERKKKNSHL